MPGRTYRGANKVPDTIRYFVDKFPMFLDSTVAGKPLVTFTFIDAGFGNLDAFHTHLDAYSSFLQHIRRFAFVFASPSPKLFDAAQKLFEDKMNPPTGKLSEQVIRYFTLRANWESKRYELLKDSDIEFMNHARQCFAGEAFESAFAEWKVGLISERHLVAVLEARTRQDKEIRFSTFHLPRDYSSFGQNSTFLKKRPENGSPAASPCGSPPSRFQVPKQEADANDNREIQYAGKSAERAGATHKNRNRVAPALS